MALCHCLQGGVQVSAVHRKQQQGRQQLIRRGTQAMHSQEKSHTVAFDLQINIKKVPL